MKSQICTLQNPNQKLSLTGQGGQVLTWEIYDEIKQNWLPLLYTGSSNKRSGIPVLFPFANPLKDNLFIPSNSEIPQHGFGRNSNWDIKMINANTARLILNSYTLDEKWQTAFPYKFQAGILIDISEQNCMTYTLFLYNLNMDVPIPIAPGIHPYFNLKHTAKRSLKSNLKPDIQKQIDWEKPTDGVFWKFGESCEFKFPEFNLTIENDVKNPAKNLVIWSQTPNQDDFDFVCLEPFCENTNAINDDPILVKNYWEINWNFRINL